MEDFRIKILGKRTKTQIIEKDMQNAMQNTLVTKNAATTEDLEIEGRDTVSDYPTVEAFNQLRVRTFISNKTALLSQASESSQSAKASKSPFKID